MTQREEKKDKDIWDKAAIVSSFVSSVIIAAVGLLINASIQETQLKSAQESARAQVQQAKDIADGQRKLQEGTLTSQLVEHLASNDPVKRRLAIAALQSAVPQETYQTIASIVIHDTDSNVRIAAYQQAATLSRPTVDLAKNIAVASEDTARSVEERNAAKTASNRIQDTLLASLRPEAAELAGKLIQGSKDKGIEIRIVSGYRTAEEQANLVEKGFSKAKVSVHMTGLAFDIGIFEEGKFVGDTQKYRSVGQLGKELGLRWGGDLAGFPDMPHFETKEAGAALVKLQPAAQSKS